MALIHGDHRLVSMVLMGSDTCEFAETLGYDGHGIGHGGYSEIMLPTSSNDFRMDKTMCFTIQGDRDTEKITDFFFLVIALQTRQKLKWRHPAISPTFWNVINFFQMTQSRLIECHQVECFW